MKKLRRLAILLTLAAAVPAFASLAVAQVPGPPGPGQQPGREPGPHPGPGPHANPPHAFRDRDPRHFSEHDWGVWRGGAWHHEWHDGRFGWWWAIGPDWYFYPEPVYPYPDPYVPPVVATQPAPVSGLPPAQVWYYCDNPPGYYPYVATCTTPWRPVPATPQPPAQ